MNKKLIFAIISCGGTISMEPDGRGQQLSKQDFFLLNSNMQIRLKSLKKALAIDFTGETAND